MKMKNIFGLTNQAIYAYAAYADALRYTSIRESAYMAVGKFIEQDTLIDWMNYLHEDIKPLITMSDAMKKENL